MRAKSTISELDEWLRELIMQAEVNRQPSWHLRAAKAGMRKRQPRLIAPVDQKLTGETIDRQTKNTRKAEGTTQPGGGDGQAGHSNPNEDANTDRGS